MPRISEDFLNTLRERVDIVELVSRYVPDLKKAGRLYKGLCPFHNEHTPSFTVYPENQSFYCFGCGKGGDVITFVRDIENLDYLEAVKFLADQAGLAMPEDNYDDSMAKKKQRMRYMNKDAARFFYQAMMNSEGRAGLQYWTQKRRLSMATVRHFGLGYAPDSWDALKKHMNHLGYSNEELYEANLVRKSEKNGRTSYYDNFRNRVMVPIIDLRGNIIAFGGRVLDDSKPKYVNTSDTLIYHKTNALFALNFAKDSGKDSMILCEGYMDVIALHQAGFTNSVAGLGTALTDEQVRLLSRYCNEVYLSYDSDGAGREATGRALEKFNQIGFPVKVLSYSGGKDPDEIIQKHGPERFKTILREADDATEYQLAEKKKLYNLQTVDGRHRYLQDAMPVLAKQDPTGRDLYIMSLADETGVSTDSIRTQLNDYLERRKRQDHYRKKKESTSFQPLLKKEGQVSAVSSNRNRKQKSKAQRAEETILTALLNNPDYLDLVDRQLDPEDFTEGFPRKLYTVLRQRIRDGQSTELIQLSGVFTPDEMAEISKPRLEGALPNTTSREIGDCIAILKERRHSAQGGDPAAMSDDEFRNIFKKKS